MNDLDNIIHDQYLSTWRNVPTMKETLFTNHNSFGITNVS